MSVHDLRNRRHVYDSAQLADGHTTDPMDLFAAWMDDAVDAQDAGRLYEAAAMTLATAAAMPDGSWQPRTRVVLLKLWDATGFTFFTNYESDKGHHLAANARASLHFHWPELHRQVRIDGTVAKVPADVSATYFAMRPRESQISAWASPQSRPVPSRDELEARQARLDEQFSGAEVPCPPHWGGYKVAPEIMEFWQGRPSRLHDRVSFTAVPGGWEPARLCP